MGIICYAFDKPSFAITGTNKKTNETHIGQRGKRILLSSLDPNVTHNLEA